MGADEKENASAGDSLRRVTFALVMLILAACGGAVKRRVDIEVPKGYELSKTASLDELVELINSRYASVETLSVSEIKVEFKSGSRERGHVEEYRSAAGYFVAQASGSIYMNILNPLTRSTLVAMATDGEDFQMWIPRDNKYLVGKTTVNMNAQNPLYNVRPHHLLNGIFVDEIPLDNPRYFFYSEETQDQRFKYYVIPVIDVELDSGRVELVRKVWIERSTMHLVRQQYFDGSRLVSDVRYSQPIKVGGALINSEIEIERKRESYTIRFELTEDGIEVNQPVRDGTFQVPRPPGAIVQSVQEYETAN